MPKNYIFRLQSVTDPSFRILPVFALDQVNSEDGWSEVLIVCPPSTIRSLVGVYPLYTIISQNNSKKNILFEMHAEGCSGPLGTRPLRFDLGRIPRIAEKDQTKYNLIRIFHTRVPREEFMVHLFRVSPKSKLDKYFSPGVRTLRRNKGNAPRGDNNQAVDDDEAPDGGDETANPEAQTNEEKTPAQLIILQLDEVILNLETILIPGETIVDREGTIVTQETTVAREETTVAREETTVAREETTVAHEETTVAREETTVAQETFVNLQKQIICLQRQIMESLQLKPIQYSIPSPTTKLSEDFPEEL